MVLLAALGLATVPAALDGCAGSASVVTKTGTIAMRSSLNTYFSDRQNGAAFRGNFYDSAATYAARDTAVTKFFARDLAQARPGDSTGLDGQDYFQFLRAIETNDLNEILSIAQ